MVILRHDVDRRPDNVLKAARLEHELGIPASYYFRAVPVSWDEDIIQKIAGMGHEIGYHYENLSMFKGDMDKAYVDFKANLERLRKLVPVSTVCMHGSPLSGIDNLDLLRNMDYKGLELVAEPYLDVDYNQVFYITDTGRKWNNEGASVRDRVGYGNLGIEELRDLGIEELLKCHSTQEIIAAVESNKFPDKVMINVHPQRWFDFGPGWVKELVGQPIKNIAKTMMIKIYKKR